MAVFLTQYIRDPRITGTNTTPSIQEEVKTINISSSQEDSYKLKYTVTNDTDNDNNKISLSFSGIWTIDSCDFIKGTAASVVKNIFAQNEESQEEEQEEEQEEQEENSVGTLTITYNGDRKFTFVYDVLEGETFEGEISETVTITYLPIAANFIETMYVEDENGSTNIYLHGKLVDANAINSNQIQNNAITSAKINNGAVTAAKLNLTAVPFPSDQTIRYKLVIQ